MRLGALCCLFAFGGFAAEPKPKPVAVQLAEAAPEPAFSNPGLRRAGIWVTSAGGVLLVGSAVCGLAGIHTNTWIRAGSDTTQEAISARDRGHRYNVAAWSLLAGGGLLLAAGVPMLLFGSRTPAQPEVGISPAGAFAAVHFQ